MRFFATALFMLAFCWAQAQINENFDDGDFTNNPQWTGDDSVFTTVQVLGNYQLRSNKTIPNTSFYLSTPSSLVNDCQWEFFVQLQFNTSGVNYVDVYLTSDSSNLFASGNNGYFVRIGSTQDDICLYKKSTGNATLIIDGTDGITNSSNTVAKIKVVRTSNNDWTLFRDMSGSGNSYAAEGSVNDATFLTSSYFGFAIFQSTSSFFQKHFFDDIAVGPVVIDVTPPALSSALALNATAVDVTFSEPVSIATAENVSNYSINNGITISSATRDNTNQSLVHLLLSNNLTNNTTYALTVNNIEDISGNVISAASNVSFTFAVPSTAQFRDLVINELYPDQTPLIALPNAEFVELYNRSSNSFNLTGWKISNHNTNGTIGNYTIMPGQYLILCANASIPLFQSYGNVIGVSSWPTLTNASDQIYLKDNNGIFIDSVAYYDTWYQDAVKAVGGWTLELINPNIPSNCAGGANWIASNHPSGGTPGQTNSVFNNTPDIIQPNITSVETPNSTTLNVCFSEPLQAQQLIPANFSINNGIGNPVTLSIAGNCVSMQLGSTLQANTTYTLTATNLSDCSGNNMTQNSSNFSYFLPNPFDVVINEIMADPSPIIGLPDAEYIELYNKTTHNISTSGWTLEHGTTIRNFPNATIPADSFLVLTSSSNLANMSIYGNVVALANLSTTALTNGGTTLKIKDNNGVLLHEVTYSDQWYNDATKASGGWSLEMIDPENPCAAGTNWTASVNPDGGSPGRRNSVYGPNPDIVPPSLGSVRILNSNQIEVEFTEFIVNQSSLNAAQFNIDNGVGIPATINFVGSPAIKVLLSLSTALQPNIIYSLTLSATLSDCAGNNSIGSLTTSFSQYDAKPFDVLINEIMADPDPVVGLPAYEYVELYNRSSFPINLAGWQFRYGTTSKSLPAATINPAEYVILCYSNAYPSLKNYGKVIVVPGMSSSAVTNSGTTLAIADTLGRVIHAVNYNDTWYNDANKINGGYSLEQIDILNPCGDKKNWRASNSILGGTPGAANSIAASNPDNIAPKIKAICLLSAQSIQVKFTEAQDSTSLINNLAYNVDNGIGTPMSVTISGPIYDQVILNFSGNFIPNTIYTLTINGTLKDCAGNILQTGSSQKFSNYQIQAYDVLINEIMAQETPVVGLPPTEYIELYNKTTFPVNLQGYNLKTGSSTTNFTCASIQPGEYFTVLQKSGSSDESVYGNAYIAESFSSLTNSGAEITLSSSTGTIISTVTFSNSWYENTQKSAGGWSLEQKDPLNPCAGASNWSASNDGIGGTPGRVNSINTTNPDIQDPEINRIAYISPNNIVVYFSEPLRAATVFDAMSYDIDNGIGNPSIVVPYLPDYKKIGLILNTPIQTGTIYTLKINGGLSDCAGNIINTLITSKFAIPQKINPGDIILNELLFNPKSGGYDFIEMYNYSNKVLTLNTIKLANVDTLNKTISNLNYIDSLGYLIFPNEYYVISQGADLVKKQYYTANEKNFINVIKMPTMNIGDGSIGLVLNSDTILDGLMYTENMHYPLIRDKKGVSLERISFKRPSTDMANWHSAAEQVGFATPGYKNSQYMDDAVADDILNFSNEIFSPDNDGYNDVLMANYKLSEPGFVGNAYVYDARGRFINQIMKNVLLGTSGSFSWDGITENNEKGNIGIYSLLFEYFDTQGNSHKVRKSFVLAGKL